MPGALTTGERLGSRVIAATIPPTMSRPPSTQEQGAEHDGGVILPALGRTHETFSSLTVMADRHAPGPPATRVVRRCPHADSRPETAVAGDGWHPIHTMGVGRVPNPLVGRHRPICGRPPPCLSSRLQPLRGDVPDRRPGPSRRRLALSGKRSAAELVPLSSLSSAPLHGPAARLRRLPDPAARRGNAGRRQVRQPGRRLLPDV